MAFGAARKLAVEPPADAVHEAQATIWVEDDIIFCRDDDDAVITGDVARARLAIHDRLSGNRRLPLLVEAGVRASVDGDARSVFLSEETTRRARAIGVVVRSRTTRVVVNAILKLARPNAPFRLFADVDSARRWIQTP